MNPTLTSDGIDYAGLVIELSGILPGQFVTGDVELTALDQDVRREDFRPTDFIGDDTYAELIRKTVVSCVDILLYYRDSFGRYWVFLPKRTSKPQPGSWVVGGRRTAFASVETGARIRALQELQINPDPSRFTSLVCEDIDLIWSESAQGIPTHTRTRVLGYQVTEEERASIRLNREYEGDPSTRWFALDELLKIDGPLYHPALRRMFQGLWRALGLATEFKFAHADDRRRIHEAIHRDSAGEMVGRATIIEVLQDGAVLGQHWHPLVEQFIVLTGRAVLYLASKDDPSAISVQFIEGPTTVTVPAGMIHTFVCEAGMVLSAVVDWPVEGNIVPSPLDLDVCRALH
ncbi:MAG TPA: hypothetical protein VJM32_05210 [Candidatus Saccharimonadales bacterium]|nr:hypothetical protein [Candidatus Saccharimonadales bacterium]